VRRRDRAGNIFTDDRRLVSHQSHDRDYRHDPTTGDGGPQAYNSRELDFTGVIETNQTREPLKDRNGRATYSVRCCWVVSAGQKRSQTSLCSLPQITVRT
jgi:hypothetical protein